MTLLVVIPGQSDGNGGVGGATTRNGEQPKTSPPPLPTAMPPETLTVGAQEPASRNPLGAMVRPPSTLTGLLAALQLVTTSVPPGPIAGPVTAPRIRQIPVTVRWVHVPAGIIVGLVAVPPEHVNDLAVAVLSSAIARPAPTTTILINTITFINRLDSIESSKKPALAAPAEPLMKLRREKFMLSYLCPLGAGRQWKVGPPSSKKVRRSL